MSVVPNVTLVVQRGQSPCQASSAICLSSLCNHTWPPWRMKMSKALQVCSGWNSTRRGPWQQIAQLWCYQFLCILKKNHNAAAAYAFSDDNKLQVIFVQRFECLLALFPFLVWLSALAIKSMSEVLWLSQPPAGTLWKSLFWGYCCRSWYESFTEVLTSYGHFCSGLPWSNLMHILGFFHDCSDAYLWEPSTSSLCKVWSTASRSWEHSLEM